MSHRKLLWSALSLSAAAALAGSALAQTGAATPGTMPPGTMPPSEPAQRISPSSGTAAGSGGHLPSSDSGAVDTGDKPAAAAHKSKHGKKKLPPQPKAEDNDNNTMPKTASPAPTSTP